MTRCSLCKEEIEHGMPIWEEQSGWAKRRTRGGLNALIARESSGRIACMKCIRRIQRKLPEGQEALW